ncbi:MAG: hypothetical protein M3401_12790, partial [Actinomycetota bacterium]|nr:hypothetical protein [Actinomycetota bacterium]
MTGKLLGGHVTAAGNAAQGQGDHGLGTDDLGAEERPRACEHYGAAARRAARRCRPARRHTTRCGA